MVGMGLDGGRSERKLVVDCKKGAGGAGLMSGEVRICYKREVSQENKEKIMRSFFIKHMIA